MDQIESSVKVVSAILINKKGKILLQLRDNNAPTSPNKISPFGGGVENGETLKQALERELYEELELDIKTNGSKPRLVHEMKSISDPEKTLNIYLITNIEDSGLKLHEGKSIIKLNSFSELKESDKSGILIGFDYKKVSELI